MFADGRYGALPALLGDVEPGPEEPAPDGALPALLGDVEPRPEEPAPGFLSVSWLLVDMVYSSMSSTIELGSGSMVDGGFCSRNRTLGWNSGWRFWMEVLDDLLHEVLRRGMVGLLGKILGDLNAEGGVADPSLDAGVHDSRVGF